MDTERDLRIKELAYRLWEDAGRPEGGADEFWYEAERRLADERQGLGEGPAAFEEMPGDEPDLSEEAAPNLGSSPKRRSAAR